MQVFKNQVLMYSHILSAFARIKQEEVYEEIEKLQRITEDLGLKMCGRILATVKTENSVFGESVSDTEFLMPIDREFENDRGYIYKPSFKMVNAVKVQHVGDVSELKSSVCVLREYISENNLQPVTGYYYSFVHAPPDSPKSSIVDIYVGINENIL